MKVFLILAIIGSVCCNEYLDDERCSEGPGFWCTNLHYARKCGAVKHCTDDVWSKQIIPTKDGAASCTVCQLMVNNARQLLRHKATEDEVSSLVTKACHIMPSGVLSEQCVKMTKDFLPEVSQLLKNERLSSQVICSLIGLCRGTETKDIKPVVKDIKPLAKDIFVNAIPNIFVPAIPETEPAKVSNEAPSNNDKLCDDCTNFFNDIREMILNNGTEAEFVNAVETQLCDQMGPLTGICKELVEQYAPLVFKYLSEEFNVNEICAAIQFCKTQTTHSNLENLIKTLKSVKISSSEECDVCKTVITELRQLDRNPEVQTTLENLLEQNVCPLLGQSADLCKQYVKAYLPILFQLLANELDPVKVCTEFGLCNGTEEARPAVQMVSLVQADTKAPPPSKVAVSVECVFCEFIMKEVASELSKNTSIDDLKKVLDEFCDALPSTIQQECTNFVNQYAAVIVELLKQEIDPKEICTKIGLCTASAVDKLFAKLTAHSYLQLKGDDIVCDTCRQVVTYMDEALKENITAKDLEMILDKLCDILPGKKECRTIVDSYTQVILQLLSQLVSPKEICEKLTLCPSPAQQNHRLYFKHKLLGTKKCTYGPAYWCASRDNAKLCGAEEHCKQHVWKN